jgi:Ca-activated chloride channel family protein
MIQPFYLYASPGIFPARSLNDFRRTLTVVGTTLIITFLLLVLLAFAAPAQLHAQGSAAREAELPVGLFFHAGRPDAAFEAPLLDSDVSIEINGLVARVTLRQSFRNPSPVWLEGLYVYPLPERSAVDRLTMLVAGRRIEGKIMERAEAEKVYQEAAARGQQASLLSAQRPNVFATSLANIGPGEEITVEIEYQDTVAYDNGRFQYRFPMVVGPRYSPPAPRVAAGERPLRAAALPQAGAPGRDLFGPVHRPGGGPANPLSLALTLDAGVPLQDLKSLYHPVVIETRQADNDRGDGGRGDGGRGDGDRGDEQHLVSLADGQVPADRDFVLEWAPRIGDQPEAAIFVEEVEGSSHLLVMLLPPRDDLSSREWDDEPKAHAVPRDVTFIVDTSGSMHGPSMDQAKEAVLKALKRLRPADRFNVIRFADETRALFAAAAPATPDNVARAWYYVKALEAEGGTMMRPALERALAAGGIGDDGRLAQVIFVTDGAVSNEDELFALIAERIGRARLFTIGIGSAPNSYFMRKSAELGRGSFTHIGNVMKVERRMEALFRKLESPALTDLSSVWPDVLGEAVQQYPRPIPDLYAGEPVVFTARLEGVALSALEGHLVIGGKRGGRDWRRRLSLNAMDDAPGVAAIWARAKLEQIEDGRYKGADPQDLRRRALAVALAHRLVTRYTSLVAVAEEVVRPPEEALESTEIARNLPEGWDYEKVFGEAGKTMRLRELPAPLLRKSSATDPIDLPRGATTARQQMLFGALFLSLSLVMLVFARLGRRLRRA